VHHKKRGSKHIKGRSTFNKPWKISGVNKDSLKGEKFSDHKRRDKAAKEASGSLENGDVEKR